MVCHHHQSLTKRTVKESVMDIIKYTEKAKCSVDGCCNDIKAKGYCQTHYARVLRRGTLELTRQKPGCLVDIGKYYTRTINGITKREHVWIAEKALGKTLPKDAIVHHVNENGKDNRNENLVICVDRAYHNFLHLRMRAIDATGDPDSRQCTHCRKWDEQSNMSLTKKRNGTTTVFYHKKCAAEIVKKNKDLRKLKNAISNTIKSTVSI